MRRLIQSNAFCLLIVLVVGLFAFSSLVPKPAVAKTVYTNGNGMAEGDPIDGLGSPSAGGGNILSEKDMNTFLHVPNFPFIVFTLVPCGNNEFFIDASIAYKIPSKFHTMLNYRCGKYMKGDVR